MALNLFKLERLKIKAFSASARGPGDSVGEFEVMFNPESFKERHEIRYGPKQALGSSDQTAVYSSSRPSDLNLRLLLDGTGVHEMGLLQLGAPKTVPERITEFLTLTVRMNGDIHEPNYLLVQWGDLDFSCRLRSVDISYTSFDTDGKALRAELDATFSSDVDYEKRLRNENRSSPDLTHSRVVKSGDTLPLLAKQIYGSSAHYLWLAEQNRLDDFRHLVPGQELVFPPLDG